MDAVTIEENDNFLLRAFGGVDMLLIFQLTFPNLIAKPNDTRVALFWHTAQRNNDFDFYPAPRIDVVEYIESIKRRYQGISQYPIASKQEIMDLLQRYLGNANYISIFQRHFPELNTSLTNDMALLFTRAVYGSNSIKNLIYSRLAVIRAIHRMK